LVNEISLDYDARSKKHQNNTRVKEVHSFQLFAIDEPFSLTSHTHTSRFLSLVQRHWC